MASVNVVCPNQKRVVVKVTPGTALFQILDEACKKQGYLTANHCLKYHAKILDLSFTFKLAGLAQNCTLEIVEKQGQNRHEVEIALQLPDGTRLNQTVPSNAALIDVLLGFENICCLKLLEPEDGEQPILQYFNHEFIGALSLATTTVSCLGIHDRALLRYSRRMISNEELRKISDSIERDQIKQRKLDETFNRKFHDNQLDAERFRAEPVESGATASSHVTDSSVETPPTGSSSSHSLSNSSHGTAPPIVHGSVPPFHGSMPPFHGTPPLVGGLSQPVGSIVSPAVHWPIGPFHGTLPSAQGFAQPAREASSQAHVTLPSGRGGTLAGQSGGASSSRSSDVGSRTNTSNRLLNEMHSSIANNSDPAAFVDFSNFKFPEHTKGMDLRSQWVDSPQSGENVQPCERRAVIYNVDNPLNIGIIEPPAEFFEVTVDDIKREMNRMKENSLKVENFAKISQASLRQQDLAMKRIAWEYSVIRIQFVNGTILQGTFRSMEKISALYQFVQSHLSHGSRLAFDLIAPVHQKLCEMDVTLIDADLAPRAMLIFKCRQEDAAFLSECLDFLAHSLHKKSQAEADHTAHECLLLNKPYTPHHPSNDDLTTTPSRTAQVPPHSSSRPLSPTSQSGRASNRPKWFKGV